MSALLYDLDILSGTNDVVYTCWCAESSCWCLIQSSGVLTRTPSYMSGMLYLPKFLFKVELLTLMYMHSFTVLPLWNCLAWVCLIGTAKVCLVKTCLLLLLVCLVETVFYFWHHVMLLILVQIPLLDTCIHIYCILLCYDNKLTFYFWTCYINNGGAL